MGQVVLNGEGHEGFHHLGGIFPTGMNSAQLQDYVVVAEFAGASRNGAFDLLLCETDNCLDLLPNADFDKDGDVDVIDRLAIRFSQSDSNRDGVVNDTDLLVAHEMWTGVQTPPTTRADPRPAPGADLIYNPFTGETWLQTRESINGFAIANADDSFNVDGVSMPFADTGTNTDATSAQIGQDTNQPTAPSSLHSLGAILPTGFNSVESLGGYLTFAQFSTEQQTGGDFNLLVCQVETCIDVLPSGDFDQDADVDVFDLLNLQTNRNRRVGPDGRAFGDANSDGVVNDLDQGLLDRTWTGVITPNFQSDLPTGGPAVDGPDADLIYNPFTGDVQIDASDTNSNAFISFVFATEQDNFRPENFVASRDGSAGPFFDVGTNTDTKTFQIGQTDPLNLGVGPIVSLGEIFAPGINSTAALDEYLTLSEYASELGQGGSFDLLICLDEACTATTTTGTGGDVNSLINSVNADLLYSPATGDVWLKAGRGDGSHIDGFMISTREENFALDNLVLPFDDNGMNTDAIASQIGQVDTSGARRITDSRALGAILPTNMTPEQLGTFLAVARYTGNISGSLDLLSCRLDDCSDLLTINADFDLDGDVDAVDAIRAQDHSQVTGNISQATGDANHDGRVNSLDAEAARDQWTGVVATTTVGGAGNTTLSGAADLIYNPSTGEVWLQSKPRDGNQFGSFVLGNADGSFAAGEFSPPFEVETTLTDRNERQLGQVTSGGETVGPFHSLGRVFPAGINSAEELSNYLTVAQYANGEDVGTFDLVLCGTEDCLELLPTADFDFDGDVDVMDQLRILNNLSRFPATHERGDANRDDFVNADDMAFADAAWTGVQTVTPVAAADPAEGANLIYNPFTGETWLQSEGGLNGFAIANADGSFNVDSLVLPFDDTGTNTDVTASQIGQASRDVSTSVGSLHSFGNLLPTGFDSKETLGDYLTVAQFSNISRSGGDLNLLVCETEACIEFLPSGDFDQDADVDVYDLLTLQTHRGLFVGRNGRARGDANSDGNVDDVDQELLDRTWTGVITPTLESNLPNNNPAGDGSDADLIYNPFNGHVTMDATDTQSQLIISFVFGTDQNNMRPQNLVRNEFGGRGPFIDVGANTDQNTFQIGQTDPLNQGAGPIVPLGEIFAPGLFSVEALDDYLTLSEYASELGVGGQFDLLLCLDEACTATTSGPIEPGPHQSSDGVHANLLYSPATGEVWLKTPRGEDANIDGFMISTAADNFVVDNFNQPFTDNGMNTDVHTSQIGQVDTTSAMAITDSHRLGAILPTDMDSTQLTEYIAVARYTGNINGPLDLLVCRTNDCSDLLTINADIDVDGDVDAVDAVLTRGRPDFVSHATGDANHDGMVGGADTMVARDQWTGVQFSSTSTGAGNVEPSDSSADLIYSPFTGEVWLQAKPSQGNTFDSFVLANGDGSFAIDELNAPFDPATTLTDQSPSQIGQVAAANEVVPSFHNLGRVFPTGIDSAEALSNYLTEASYGGENGVGSFDLLVCETEACTDHLPSADFDVDGDIDAFDLLTAYRNQGDRNPSNADGDANRDGVIDIADIQSTQGTWTGIITPVPRDVPDVVDTPHADLIYNPFTGAVQLDASDTQSGQFVSFVLGTREDNFRPENFVESEAGNAGPFMDVGTQHGRDHLPNWSS